MPDSRTSDEAVLARTGRSWREWIAILDHAGAERMTHNEIVGYLTENHQLGPWWRQTVAVTYQQRTGLRDEPETTAGYRVTGRKLVPAPLSLLYRAWADGRVRKRWLPGTRFNITKAIPPKSLQIRWNDGSQVDVLFHSRGRSRSQVSVLHMLLPNPEAAEIRKMFWKERLARLAAACRTSSAVRAVFRKRK